MTKVEKISEIKKTIEQLERVYDIINCQLDCTKEEAFQISLKHLNGIQERIEELLHEAQIIELLNEVNIKK